MLLNVENLVAGYGAFRALKSVSLRVAEGELVAIMGANGAGKTTLIKAIVSLVKILHGTVEFDGDPIDRLPSHEIIKRGISVCPEGGGCFPEMSVYKNLIMGAVLFKDRSALREAYSRVEKLFPVLHRRKMQKAGSLSGGERQMLAIARALMGTPRLLLMDEPSLGLAPMIVNDIFKAIERLKNQGLTILLIEQNASKALKVADRGYVMELGEILISGASEELMEDEGVKKAYLGM